MTTWGDYPAGARADLSAAPAGNHGGGWRGLARRLAARITWR